MPIPFFDLFYLILSVVATIFTAIVAIILINAHKKFEILGLLLYSTSMIMLSVHSLTHALMFITKPKFYIFGKEQSLLDFIHTIAVFVAILTLYIAVEYSHTKEIPARSLIIFFMAGGALAAEFLNEDPLAEPLALTLEAIALVLFLLIAIINYARLLTYVEKSAFKRSIIIFLVGFVLFVSSLITNIIFGYLHAPQPYLDIWEIQFIIGVLLLTYVLYNKPYIILEAYSRPKLFIVTDTNGEILYLLQLDRKLTRTDIRKIEDYIRGLPILSKELLGSSTAPRELKFKDFEMIIAEKNNIIGIFIAQKTSKTLEQILEVVVNKFCEEALPCLKKEKPTNNEIEKIQYFDLEVKKLITEATY